MQLLHDNFIRDIGRLQFLVDIQRMDSSFDQASSRRSNGFNKRVVCLGFKQMVTLFSKYKVKTRATFNHQHKNVILASIETRA